MSRILALDVAFAHLGWAIMEPKGKGWICLDAYVIETKKSDKKKNIRAAPDALRRCIELFDVLNTIITRCEIKGIIAEIPPGGGQNSNAVKLMGMASAVVAVAARVHDLPVEWTDPLDGKRALTGKKNASKKLMMLAAAKSYPGSTKTFKFKKGSKKEYENRYEHTADAIAAFVSAKDGTLARLLHQQ